MSADVIEIVLLGAPRGKERPRFSKASGTVYTPQKTRDYEAALRYAAIEVMRGRPLLEGPLGASIRAVLPIAPSWSKARRAAALAGVEWPIKKPDLDNINKHLDALNLVVYQDDAQLCETTIKKVYGPNPGLWIRIWPLTTNGSAFE